MKAFRIAVITLLVGGILGFAILRSSPEATKIFTFSQCETPVAYKLGTLDPKFGLNQATANTDIKDAADIWAKTYGKPLFVESSAAVLTVNFVYDERSALNSRINQLQNQLDQNNKTLDQQVKSYEADVAAFEKKLADFNARVEGVNRSGGASPELYNSLKDEQKQLQQEAEALNARAKELNLATNDYNSQVNNLNQNVGQFNEALVEKPEEGIYNVNDNTITVYFVNSRSELIHTLAHEFGHVLGMQHTQDPKALMYAQTSTTLTVTPEDKQQLDYVCREQSLPSHWLRKFITWFYSNLRLFSRS